MEPVTHALASLAVARAGLDKTTRLATPLLVVSGLAADLDLLSYVGGPGTYLHFHRALAHSFLGSGVLVVLLAGVFWLAGRRHLKAPLAFLRVLSVCALGAAVHLLLDLCTSDGVQLLWPFRVRVYAWDLLAPLDPWVLVLLTAGLLLPGLFRLVSEEIGERKRGQGPLRGAVVALVLLALYIGARGMLHADAVGLLLSREYHRAVPLAADAFPSPDSPFAWRGVAATANTFEEVEVGLGPGAHFDPDRSRTYYRPEPSPALEAAEHAQTARAFVVQARFPLASLDRMDDGYRLSVRDLRFPAYTARFGEVIAVVELDHQLEVKQQGFRFNREQSR